MTGDVERLRRQVLTDLWAEQQRILGELVARLRALDEPEATECADLIAELLDEDHPHQ